MLTKTFLDDIKYTIVVCNLASPPGIAKDFHLWYSGGVYEPTDADI